MREHVHYFRGLPMNRKRVKKVLEPKDGLAWLAGYEDVNDAARLSQDPTFRLIGSRKIWERGGLDLALAVVRDRSADAGGKLCRAGRAQPRVGRQSRGHRFTAAGSA